MIKIKHNKKVYYGKPIESSPKLYQIAFSVGNQKKINDEMFIFDEAIKRAKAYQKIFKGINVEVLEVVNQ